MAQWMGQFSGRTHASKVRDLSEMLERAIAAARQSSPEQKNQKIKSVRKIAAQLLRAELKSIRAKISQQVELLVNDENGRLKVKGLRESEAELSDGGVAAILRRFGAEEFNGAQGEDA